MLLLSIIPIKYFEHIICQGEMNFLGASVLIYSLYLFLHAIVASRRVSMAPGGETGGGKSQ